MTMTPSIECTEHSEHVEHGEHGEPRVDTTQAILLSELVGGLTAVRNEAALRRTIDRWKIRVRDSGFDPDALIDLFKGIRADRDEMSRDYSWAQVDKRELVLVSIDVYTRSCSS
jgi:hypothetical protein